MTDTVDVLVVGAGVVGLAVARSLSKAGRDVLLIDRAADIGTETSSRNSEVIHSGIYYPIGSLKAKLCVEGRHALYDFCREHGVQTKMLGKFIVATTDNEIPKLRALQKLGEANGVTDLLWFTAEEMAIAEPAVVCRAGLLSPSTGIIDSRTYMLALQAETEVFRATIALRTTFVSAKAGPDTFSVNLKTDEGDDFEIACKTIVNCAGHYAHTIAAAIAGFDAAQLPPCFLAKGNYCGVSGASPFSRLIYPIPVPGALGIHVTLDMDNRVRLGPDIEWIERFDYAVNSDIIPRFYDACATYWPGVRDRELSTAYCGIRPKVHDASKASADFIIQGPADHGLPGLVNLFGIESPGLTSSLAIGGHVARLLA